MSTEFTFVINMDYQAVNSSYWALSNAMLPLMSVTRINQAFSFPQYCDQQCLWLTFNLLGRSVHCVFFLSSHLSHKQTQKSVKLKPQVSVLWNKHTFKFELTILWWLRKHYWWQCCVPKTPIRVDNTTTTRCIFLTFISNIVLSLMITHLGAMSIKEVD